MKIISSSSMLQREFARLMAQYDEFLWATAWAGIGSEAFKGLVGHSDKISRIVVGLHFFQTHPDFIAAFMTHKGVRFIKQTTGTFHPKVYLFRGGSYWELLVGS